MTIKIGVLALQGDFAKHIDVLRSMGVEVIEVRKPEDLSNCMGLIIPGGESTVMLRQIDFIKLKQPLLEFAQQRPVFGTCAGLILMSSQIQASSMQPLGLLDVAVERNAFGRQIESFTTSLELNLESEKMKRADAFFIRAPRIRQVGPAVKILASFEQEAVLVQQGFHLGASFHPELTQDSTIHRYFLEMIRKQSETNK